ncbi:hypothetical protein HYPSUDRAFT_78186 [Hypholoma sublateritium FD-334 SS-4]|uniref:Uncharacterized protein n=1 Tax=Hypholoma sublateritium (strain FD-334 SS-4) TaxID=945553 RepID=A0A0D2NWA7_HYPSF|nr:hypothetical protein HYPSUDRAFT_78186 [Hypholoma sublateritium FD-334 SS-4]
MAAKFLCCLPLRLGVLIISFLQFLFCGAFAGLLWWALLYGAKHNSDISTITHSMKTVVIVTASVYTASALVGLLGLLGAVLRKHGFVRIFSFLLCATLSVEVGSSIWYLITFYHTRGQTEAECVNGSTDQARIAYCKSLDAYRRVPQGALLASVIVPLVLQAYACYVVYQYSKRLQYQRADRQRSSSAFVPPVGPMYQPLKHADETHMLAQQYPYSDSTHAFGHKPQSSIDKV